MGWGQKYGEETKMAAFKPGPQQVQGLHRGLLLTHLEWKVDSRDCRYYNYGFVWVYNGGVIPKALR